MSHDRKAPEPLKSGTGLGMTMAAGTVTPGGAYVMSDALRDELYIGALAADRLGRFTRPMGTGEETTARPKMGVSYGWDARQQAAERRLAALWKKSLRGLGAPGGYGDRTRGGGGEISDEEARASTEAFREYSAAMEWLGARCSARHVEAVRQAVVYETPTVLAFSHLAREALTELANLWAIK